MVGLVWSGVLLSHVHLTCLHGLNATNEVVMCFSSSPFSFALALQGGTRNGHRD